MLRKRLAHLLWASLLLPAAALGEPPAALPAVAVMDFGASNAPASEAVVISDFVRSAAVRCGKFRVVDKKNMESLLAEQAFQQTGCTSSDCAVKLGKLLNVQKMVVGEYAILAGVRYLSAHLVDVETGVMERSAKVKGFDGSSADDSADDLMHQLSGGAPSPTDLPSNGSGPLSVWITGGWGPVGVTAHPTPVYQGTFGATSYKSRLVNADTGRRAEVSRSAFGIRCFPGVPSMGSTCLPVATMPPPPTAARSQAPTATPQHRCPSRSG